MLYHLLGMSFSSRTNFVRWVSDALAAMPASLRLLRGGTLVKSALTIRNPGRGCQHALC